MKKLALPAVVFASIAMGALAARAEPPTGDGAATPSPVTASAAADQAFGRDADLEAFRKLPIQIDGRRKPLDTWARERVFTISGERRLRGEDPVFTALKWTLEPERSAESKIMPVRNLELTKAFTGESDVGKCYVSPRDIDTNPQFRMIAQTRIDWTKKPSQWTPLEQAVFELNHETGMFKKVPSELKIIPVTDDPTPEWASPDELPALFPDGRFKPFLEEWTALTAALHARDAKGWNDAAAKVTARLHGYGFVTYPTDAQIDVEYAYNRFRPLLMAAWLYAIAAGVFLLSRAGSFFAAGKEESKGTSLARWSRRAGVATFGAGVLAHIAGLAARAWIAQRAPVASFYETIVFMSAAATLFAVIFETIRPQGVAGLWGSLLGTLALMLGNSIPAYVETQSIEPLVPVLRSYWLNIHVTCMLTSYGALALAFGVGLDYGANWLFYKGPDREDKLARLDDFNYRVIQVGWALLTVGTGLGAVWANESWGRPWGWDPKETGALITIIIYAAYLHARFMGWVKGIGATIWNVCGFMGVLFTYVVVGFFLKGLHSYLQ